MSKPEKPSFFQSEVMALLVASLTLLWPHPPGLILRTCLIMALSLRCRFALVNGQVSLAWSSAHKHCHMATGLVREVGGCEK